MSPSNRAMQQIQFHVALQNCEIPFFKSGMNHSLKDWSLDPLLKNEIHPFWEEFYSLVFNPLNPAGRFSGLRKQGAKNPAGRFSDICYGVSKTRRVSKPPHVRLIINWFVYTGRYQATLRSQVESSSLLSFRTICNLLTSFCTQCTILRRKYGGDTQCMWRYWYSLDAMDNVEELYNQKIGFWDRNGGIHTVYHIAKGKDPEIHCTAMNLIPCC